MIYKCIHEFHTFIGCKINWEREENYFRTLKERFLFPGSIGGCLVLELLSTSLYSCMIQLVLIPLGGFPPQKTRAFFTPTFWLPLEVKIGLSVPVAFQYPEVAARLGLAPFGYFRSLGLKKYHSCSPNVALPNQKKKIEPNHS